jgi:hypothetical protein
LEVTVSTAQPRGAWTDDELQELFERLASEGHFQEPAHLEAYQRYQDEIGKAQGNPAARSTARLQMLRVLKCVIASNPEHDNHLSNPEVQQ